MKIATKVKSILGALTLGSVCVMNASAAEYVCSVKHVPGASVYGNNGYVSVSVSNGPKCTSGIKYGINICTGGATNSTCATTSFLYSENSLLAILKELNEAAKSGTEIIPSPVSCIGGASGCWGGVRFFAY